MTNLDPKFITSLRVTTPDGLVVVEAPLTGVRMEGGRIILDTDDQGVNFSFDAGFLATPEWAENGGMQM